MRCGVTYSSWRMISAVLAVSLNWHDKSDKARREKTVITTATKNVLESFFARQDLV